MRRGTSAELSGIATWALLRAIPDEPGLRNFQTSLEREKLPRIRLYDLRHTAATLALAAGVPAKVVSEQLGHASVAVTLDTRHLFSRFHVLPHIQDAAAAQVEALLLNTVAKKRATRKRKRPAKDKKPK